MKYLGLILVVALVAGQVLAQRINVNDRRSERKCDSDTAADLRYVEFIDHRDTEVLGVKRGLSDSFRGFLENFKRTMREGNQTLGIPKLDPFKRDFYNAKLNNKFMRGEIKLTDFEVSGLSEYRVRAAEVSVFYRTLTIGLTWPRLFSMGDYKLDDVVLNSKAIHGDGDYYATAKNLSIDSVISIGVWGGLSVKSMDTKVSLGGFSLSMFGLYDEQGSPIDVSQAVSNVVPQLVRDYQREIVGVINNTVMAFLNKLLEGKSISDLGSLFG